MDALECVSRVTVEWTKTDAVMTKGDTIYDQLSIPYYRKHD